MAIMTHHYDRQGREISMAEWGRMFEDDDERRVAFTEIGDQVTVSTVWLGLDHNFGFGGPPLIFETMIFGGPLHEEQERYATEEQALAGHEDMVKRARYAHSAELGES